MNRSATLLVAVALSLTPAWSPQANAASLGIDGPQIPQRPASMKPTMSMKERKQAVLSGNEPGLLVPKNYLKNGRLTATKYYTADGEVLRRREVLFLLKHSAQADVTERMREYELAQRKGMTWTIVYVGTIWLFPLNTVFLIPSIPYSVAMQHHYEDAIHDYNVPPAP